jgi:hypothetical protein
MVGEISRLRSLTTGRWSPDLKLRYPLFTNGPKPTDTLKIVPTPLAPPWPLKPLKQKMRLFGKCVKSSSNMRAALTAPAPNEIWQTHFINPFL